MKKYLFILGAIMLLPISVNAENATIDISSSKKNVSPGDSITVTANVEGDVAIGYYEYTLDYDHDKLKLTSGSSYNVDRANNNNTTKFSKTFKFKVTDEGTSKISVKSYAATSYKNETNMKVKVNPVTIVSNLENTNNNNYSTNNNLSSLEVEGFKISPTFSKKTTKYKLSLDDDVEEIKIKATTEDENANVSGTGKHSLTPGDNKFEIIVTSEKGEEKIYVINVTVEDKNPIKIEVNNKTYTVVKNIESLKIPDNYKIIDVKINDTLIKGAYSDITKYTLVGLKDEQGNTSLYIYDNDTNSYTSYNEIIFEQVSFLPISSDEKLEGHQLYNETINKIDIECYKISSDSNYCVIYGMNLKTGEKGWYSYNKEENTIQKYNDEIKDYYNEKVDSTKILVYILSGTTLLFGITTIVLAIKKGKKK